MTLEPLQHLQNKDKTRTNSCKNSTSRLSNGTKISYDEIKSAPQNYQDSSFPEEAPRLIAQESVMFKPNGFTIPKLQSYIDYIRTLLNKKGSADFLDDDIAIYLYKKFFIEANDARKNKKYEDAIKKYQLVLECVQGIKKDGNETEDIQNLIAICYGQLGLKKGNWQKGLKAYQEALKFARDPNLIKQLEGNKITIVWHKLAEIRALIANGLYQEASKICQKILEPSVQFEKSYHNLIKNGTRDYHTWSVVQDLLDQTNKNPTISNYNKIIAKVTKNFKTATHLSQDGQIYYPEDFIASACNGIISCYHDQKNYPAAEAAYEKGLKFSKSPQTLNALQKNYILTLKLYGEDFFKKKQFAESAQKYHEAFKIIKNLPDTLKEKIEISVELFEHLIHTSTIEQAIENISKAWEIFIDPQYQFSSDFFSTIQRNRIKLQIEFSNFCFSQNDFKGTLENCKGVLEVCKDKDIRELIHKSIIESWFSYMNDLKESGQALKELQKLLIYHFDQNANFKVATGCLNQVEKILEKAKPDDIVNLNITPEAIHLQMDIMHIVVKRLCKAKKYTEALGKLDQILASTHISHQCKQEAINIKSLALIGLNRQTEASEDLAQIITTYETAILSSSDGISNTSARINCLKAIEKVIKSWVNHDKPKKLLKFFDIIPQIIDEELKSSISSKIDHELALLAMKKGELNQAIELLDKAFSKAITDQDKTFIAKDKDAVLVAKVNFCLEHGHNDEAIKAFMELKKLDNSNLLMPLEAEIYNYHHNWVMQSKQADDGTETLKTLQQMLQFITDPQDRSNIEKQISKIINQINKKTMDLFDAAYNSLKKQEFLKPLKLFKQVEQKIQSLVEDILIKLGLNDYMKISQEDFIHSQSDKFSDLYDFIKCPNSDINNEVRNLCKILKKTKNTYCQESTIIGQTNLSTIHQGNIEAFSARMKEAETHADYMKIISSEVETGSNILGES